MTVKQLMAVASAVLDGYALSAGFSITSEWVLSRLRSSLGSVAEGDVTAAKKPLLAFDLYPDKMGCGTSADAFQWQRARGLQEADIEQGASSEGLADSLGAAQPESRGASSEGLADSLGAAQPESRDACIVQMCAWEEYTGPPGKKFWRHWSSGAHTENDPYV